MIGRQRILKGLMLFRLIKKFNKNHYKQNKNLMMNYFLKKNQILELKLSLTTSLMDKKECISHQLYSALYFGSSDYSLESCLGRKRHLNKIFFSVLRKLILKIKYLFFLTIRALILKLLLKNYTCAKEQKSILIK